MWGSAIAALGEMLAKLFEWRTSKTEHQSETEVIKDKKDYKKANEEAVKAFKVVEKYKDDMSLGDRLLFLRHYMRFEKYN